MAACYWCELNFSVSSLAAGFIFGVFGMFLLRRGKSDAHFPHALLGLSLIVYPYFIENDYLLWIVGIALLFVAWVMR